MHLFYWRIFTFFRKVKFKTYTEVWTRRWLVAVVKEGGGRFENQMKREALGKGGVVGLVERETQEFLIYPGIDPIVP